MQIVCPTCATCYQVSASSIGAAGRSVRCVRCRAIWLASPETEAATDQAVAAFRAELADQPTADTAGILTPEASDITELGADRAPTDELTAADALPATDIETVAAATAIADHPVDLDAGRPPIVIDETPSPETSPAAGTPPNAEVESLASYRHRRQGRRPPPLKTASRRWLPAVIAGLLVLIGALLGWRGEVVRHAPQMASLYSAIGLPVNLRKMVFTDVRMTRETHDGVPVLLIQGTIVSTSATPTVVPRLRFAMRNAAGAELYSWTAQPAQPKLAPFESLAFQSRLASPPGDGHDIVVRFFNRRDAVASLR